MFLLLLGAFAGDEALDGGVEFNETGEEGAAVEFLEALVMEEGACEVFCGFDGGFGEEVCY